MFLISLNRKPFFMGGNLFYQEIIWYPFGNRVNNDFNVSHNSLKMNSIGMETLCAITKGTEKYGKKTDLPIHEA